MQELPEKLQAILDRFEDAVTANAAYGALGNEQTSAMKAEYQAARAALIKALWGV